jgi:exonuclease VII small subunit
MLLELKSLTSFINDGVSELREDFAMFKQGLESSKLGMYRLTSVLQKLIQLR